jgi:nucleoside-diphosphate-sugar epimerase
MRILVTGGAGYVGSSVVAHLLGVGNEVTVFDRLDFGAQSLVPFLRHRSFTLVQGDVRDAAALRAAMRESDAVVHLAAIVGEPACLRDPAGTEEINRDAATAAIEMADSLGVGRFLFFSTCSNYGVQNVESLADEDSPLNPLSLYARTKVEVEQFALAKAGRLGITVLRLGTICGLSGRMRFDLLVNEMARSAVLGQTIEIYRPLAWRPFLHAGDVGRVIEHVLGVAGSRVFGRVFNVVGENYQKTGLAELARKHVPDARIIVTDAQPDNRDYRVSGERIERELGFKTAYSVEDAFVEVARAVADGVFVDPMWPGHSAIPLQVPLQTVAVEA